MSDPATTSDKGNTSREEAKKRYEVLIAAYLFVARGGNR